MTAASVERGGPAAIAPWPRMVRAQTGMELRLTARRFENLFVMLVIPPALLAFFGAVPVLSTGAAKPVDFLLPGVLALAVISTAFVNLGIATGFERGYGVLKRLGGSPLPRSGLIAAKLLAVAAVEVVQVVLLVGIAVVVFGWSPGAGASLPVALAALILGTLAFAGLGLLLAGSLRPEATLAIANGAFLLFLLLGGVVLPLDHLPGPLEAVARLLPAAALSDLLRAALGGTASAAGDLVGPFIVLVAWGVAGVGLAVRTFRWE
jgi:ABC-2 type transport system permease protein